MKPHNGRQGQSRGGNITAQACLPRLPRRATPSAMAIHRFTATHWHNVLGTLPPALTIASGDIVITETIDAHGIDKDGVQRAPEPNPMNGPIFVTGAEPGDALKVEILRMTPIRADRLDPRVARRQRRRPGIRARPAAAGQGELADRPAGADGNAGTGCAGPGGSRAAARTDDRLLRRRARNGAGLLHRDQRRERRQHGLSRLRSRRDSVVSGRGRQARCSFSATAMRHRAMARSSAPASRPASRSRCG